MTEKISLIRKIYRKLLYRDLDKIYDKILSQPRKKRNNKKLLDVGSGWGFELAERFIQGYDIFGIDIDKTRINKMVTHFKIHNVSVVGKVSNAEKLPFKSNFFDVVISSHVLEHVHNDRNVLKEIFRVLKKNGKFELRVPNENNLHTKFRKYIGSKNPYTDRTHLREYTRNHLTSLLREIGFKIKKIEMRGFIPPIGLRVVQLMGSYVPINVMTNFLGEMFKENSAEIFVICTKN